jgi:hypothetical protein
MKNGHTWIRGTSHRLLCICLLLLGNGLAMAQALPQQMRRIDFKYDGHTAQAEYILVGDTMQRRPLLIFIAGSMPGPLFIEANGKVYPVYVPFDERVLGDQFQLLVLNKPGVPAVCKETDLDASGNLGMQSGVGDLGYFQRCNELGYHVAAHRAVLKQVLKLNCVDASKVVVVGHSQGARVATEFARTERAVTHLAYLSCDPQGRMSDLVRRELGQPFGPDFVYDSLLKTMAALHGNKVKLPQDHPDYGTLSFSRNLLPDLAGLKIPLFVGYGDADPACVDCAEIAVACARAGKREVRMEVVFLGDHNFIGPGVGPEGMPIENDMKWDAMAKMIVEWAMGK